MQTFDNTFKRKEMKYLLSADRYACARAALAPYMMPDTYGATAINTCYLDTPDRALIQRSLEKPLYKEKLRVRRYGDGDAPDTPTFVEIKKKYKGIVYKRRICMGKAAAEAFLAGMPYERAIAAYPLTDAAAQARAHSPQAVQIAAEIFAFNRRWGRLDPSMDIRVIRTAWKLTAAGRAATPEGFDVRITFDECMRARDRFEEHASWADIATPGEVLMEIKITGAYPLWLVDILNECGCTRTSFSKYGTAYLNLRKGGRQCSIA